MKYDNRRIKIAYKEQWHECDLVLMPSNSLDVDKPLTCPHCKRFLAIITETEEHTRFYDKFTLLLMCAHCRSAWLHTSAFEARFEPAQPETALETDAQAAA